LVLQRIGLRLLHGALSFDMIFHFIPLGCPLPLTVRLINVNSAVFRQNFAAPPEFRSFAPLQASMRVIQHHASRVPTRIGGCKFRHLEPSTTLKATQTILMNANHGLCHCSDRTTQKAALTKLIGPLIRNYKCDPVLLHGARFSTKNPNRGCHSFSCLLA
jgi:hypothetical protein